LAPRAPLFHGDLHETPRFWDDIASTKSGFQNENQIQRSWGTPLYLAADIFWLVSCGSSVQTRKVRICNG